MRDEEKRQQKAMLLCECQKAEASLARLREKVGRMSESFSDVGFWLNRAGPLHYPGYVPEDAARNASIRANLGGYKRALNFDDAVALMDEIVKAEDQLENLSRRKAELDLK